MDLDAKAKEPFKFYSVYFLPLYTRIKASTFQQFVEALDKVDKYSVFFHIFHPMVSSTFIKLEDLNDDFSFWIRESLHEEYLAELLTNIDVSEPLNIEDIRKNILSLLKGIKEDKPADEPFIFISCYPVTFPLSLEAYTLGEFLDAVSSVSPRSIFYHMIYRRIIGETNKNDFSNWLESNFGIKDASQRLSSLDPLSYKDMEIFRKDILDILEDCLL